MRRAGNSNRRSFPNEGMNYVEWVEGPKMGNRRGMETGGANVRKELRR